MPLTQYGNTFGKRFGAETAPAFVIRSLRQSEIGVTHMVQNQPTNELSERFPADDAHIISYVLRDSPNYTLWENERPLPPRPVLAGQITFNDVKTDPYMLVNDPMVAMHYYIPRAAFDALADASDAPRISNLVYPHGTGIDDPVVRHLSLALLPAFERQNEANRLFVDYVTLAIAAHVARTYGDMKFYLPKRGGLAPWQEKRAKELIDAHLEGSITQDDLARECGLSRSHFARAFRVTLGEPPHRWLLRRRIDRAKVMMLSSTASLAEISISCGFADQGHFTRIFSSFMNTPPGTWRRNNRN
tara:strand:+ start:2288 stop:3193 length:906 start_codon:yes stop_codon:yes gene_type:complete